MVLVEVLQVAGQAPSMHKSPEAVLPHSVYPYTLAFCTWSSGNCTAGGAGAGLTAAVGLGCQEQAGDERLAGWLDSSFFCHS